VARADPPFAFKVIGVATGLLLAFGALEVTLRLLPVQDVARHTEIDETYQVNRFRPHSVLTWSSGWDFAIRTRKQANDLGYLNDQDFAGGDGRPVFAVIGDSFVEALQVPNGGTFHGLLHQGLGSRGQAFGIGQSGASLADYLAYATMARQELRPAALAFVIIANDYDETLCAYAFRKGVKWCFEATAAGGAQAVPVRHPPRSWLRLALADTALWRYASHNLGATPAVLRQRLQGLAGGAGTWAGNMPATVDAAREAAALRGIELFFRDLPARTGLPPDRILFVMDGVRDAIYDGRPVEDTYVGRTRNAFLAAARDRGHEVIDMHEAFAAHYARNRQRFEFPGDGHWNALGHQLVAGAITGSVLYRRVFVGQT